MRPERRIPTIFALLILIFGIGGVITLIERPFSSQSQADISKQPQDIRITNVSDSMVTVSWMTEAATTGSIVYGESEKKRVEVDDRDHEGKIASYRNHHVTLRGLAAEKTYPYQIISGGKTFNDQGRSYTFTSGYQLSSLPPAVEPSYGKVVTATNQSAAHAIVFLNVGGSATLSTLVNDQGEWLIPVSTARTLAGKNYALPKEEAQIEIVVRGDDGATSTIVTDIHNDAPVPMITLGKTYNFREKPQEEIGSPVLGAKTQEGADSQKKKEATIEIIVPGHNSALTTNKPLIRGAGIPGKIVRLSLESTPQYGQVTVGADGRWSWAPERSLAPGTHIVTIRTTNEQGKEVVKTQRFLVLKSGTQVLGEATPSGTLTPTASPTQIPSLPTATPTIIPSLTPSSLVSPTIPPKQPIPRSGNVEPTLLVLGVGLALIFIGFVRLGSLPRP